MKEIINAKDRKVSELASSLPDVAGAVQLLMKPVTALVMQKQQVAGYTQETPLEVVTKASIQPFTARQLMIRPEGQRTWKWYTMWCLRNLVLKPDDVFVMHGTRYRIMEMYDWRDYGYFSYSVVEDYQTNAPDESHSD